MIRFARILALVAALLPLAPPPALADQILPPGRITTGNDILFGALKLGKRQAGKTVLQPDTIELQGAGSTGEASAFSWTPSPSAAATTLGRVLADLTTSWSRAALVAGTIALQPTVTAVRTLGYAAPGDGGGATYARRSSEPTHPGKFYASGAWWEIVPGADGFDLRQFGAKEVASLVTPISTVDAGTNTTAINDAASTAKAFGYVPVRVRGRFVHSGALTFVGDHKFIGDGITPHAYAAAQLTRTGPSALLYSGSGTQVTLKNEDTIGKPIIRGAQFTGIELITLYGSALGLRVNGAAYSKIDVYTIGHDLGTKFDVPDYSASNQPAGGEDGYTCHNELRLIAQATKTALAMLGDTDPAKGNVCKNRIRISADYSTNDAIILGNSDSNDFEEVYLYKIATTWNRIIATAVGSNVVTVNDASNLAVGMYVFADDIPSGSSIKSISGNSLTLQRDGDETKARALKTKPGSHAGFSIAAGRGVVSQGGSAYSSSARSNVWSGILEPGEGGMAFLGTEHAPVASQANEIRAWNYENNSFNSSRVTYLGTGATLTLAGTDGRRLWTDLGFWPTGRATGEWRIDGTKALGFEANGMVTLPRKPAVVAFLNANLVPTADGSTRTVVVGQEARLNNLAAYSTSTGAFTCPATGLYRVKAKLLVTPGSSNGALVSGYVTRNGAAIDGQDAFYQHVGGIWGAVDVDTLAACSTGETLGVSISASAAVTISGAAGRFVSRLSFEFGG